VTTPPSADWGQLAPYLPRVALDWPDDGRRWQAIDASLVFADVSGFTALSEKLAKRGSIGAEELTQTLGTVFGSMLDNAYSRGGSLLKFGGDALLLMFDGEGHAPRAMEAARSLRRAARRLGQLETSVGRLRIRASIGAHTGTVSFFRVGKLHQELIVAGPTVTRTLVMEGAAGPGEILLSPELCDQVDASLLDGKKGPGWLLSDRSIQEISGVFPPTPAPIEDPLVSIPVALRHHLTDEGRTSEHRSVTVGFLKFSGLDGLLASGQQVAADALDEMVSRVQTHAEACGVTFLGSDVDKDGGKIVLSAGAPVANPDDSERLVATLRKVLTDPLPLQVRAGIHRGKVFAGDIGPSYRRTYTVMGDAVNTAARVMASAAPSELLISPVVADQVGRAVTFREARHVKVKGKAQPLEVIPLDLDSVSGTGESSDVRLVGRDAELETLRTLAADLVDDRGAVVEIRGEAGIGKSALARTVPKLDGVKLSIDVATDPYSGDSAWSLARRVLAAAQSAAGDRLSLDQAIEQAIDRAPQLVGMAGLLGDVFAEVASVPVPLEPQLRRVRTEELLVELLGQYLPGGAALLVEDIQAADDASLSWLRRLGAEAPQRGWLMVLTRRGDGQSLVEWAHRLKLEPLGATEARSLLREVSGGALRPWELERLTEQGAGNPLFLRELASSAAAGGDLPDSVGAAFAGRIDRLSPSDARLLRSASVLGAQFDPVLLAQIVEADLPSASELVHRWGGLVEPAGHQLRFSSPLAREAAYDTLPHRTRAELHGRAADHLSGGAVEDANQLALLSLHLERARRWRQCWKAAKAAGRRASAIHASVEAAGLYERAIRAGSASAVRPAELSSAWRRAGDCWHRAGYLDRASDAYRSARRLTTDRYVQAAILSREARLAEMRGEALATTRRIRRALRLLDGVERRQVSLKASLEVMHGWASLNRGRPKEAARWASLGLNDATASGNSKAQAEARLLREWCAMQRGLPVSEAEVKRALHQFERRNDPSRAAFTLNLLGALAYYRGDWEAAGRYYSDALEKYEKAGNEADAAHARYNAAEILLDQGRLDEAEDVLDQVCDLYRTVGYRAGLSLIERDRGRIALRRGEIGPARQRFDAARREFEDLQASARVLEVDAWMAEVDLQEGRAEEAADRLARATERARSEGVGTVLSMLLRLQGYARLAVGDMDGAAAAFAESLSRARAVGGLYDVALGLCAEAEMANRQEVDWPDSSRRERDKLFAQLGMIEAPAPLSGNRGFDA